MTNKALGFAIVMCALATVLAGAAFAQAPAVALQAPAGPAPEPGAAGRGGGNQGVGRQGDPDPGVHFITVVDNVDVRVLQVTLQPSAVRRPHVHNDVSFNVIVPVTGSLVLTVEGQAVTTVLGQAYYIAKGQTHGFTNSTAAPVQVVELFIKPPVATPAAQ